MSQGKSVGAIIRDKKGRYLAQYRLREPIGLALPAGHIDKGETPEEALKRELLEETGLRAIVLKLVLNAVYPNPCAKNHNSHEWWVYEVEAGGAPELKEPGKHRFLKFMAPSEIKAYVLRDEYDPAWFDYIFPSLGIVI